MVTRAAKLLYITACHACKVYAFRPSCRQGTVLFSSFKPPDFTIIEDDSNKDRDVSTDDDSLNKKEAAVAPSSSQAKRQPKRTTPKRQFVSQQQSGNWMERNSQFNSKNFRQDFRGTRVFVQNIPEGVSWQTLKDHFRVVGEVVFASIGKNDPTTGIVQFETTEEAQTAIRIMREHPLNDSQLYVRKDVQENKSDKNLEKKWKCANPEEQDHPPSLVAEIEELLLSRDKARRLREFNVADSIRQDLFDRFGVQIDDRLQLWWWNFDETPPDASGHASSDQPAWEQIPTNFDDQIDSDRVFEMLRKRDQARRIRDYETADRILNDLYELPSSPGMTLRIHDESRTWRMWSEKRPRSSPAEQALLIVREFAPHKISEVENLLNKFPGREYQILKKLKQRYLGEQDNGLYEE